MSGHDGTRRRLAPQPWLLAITGLLLAGLVVTAGVQCTNDMPLPFAPETTLAGDMSAMLGDWGAPAAAGAASSFVGGTPTVDGSLPMAPGTLIGTCMALLAMALLAVGVALRRGRTRAWQSRVAAVRRVVTPPPLMGAPSLARLCVLRM